MTPATPQKTSPMMSQWYACKQKAKDALLLFRLGDFYEAFYEDAKILSEAIDVTLTQRQGIPMSGVPAHAAEGYIEKLVEKGFLVAIAEQTEDPKAVKGLVKREVVRVVSPGTLLTSLPENANNFFGALSLLNQTLALALLDFSTGEFHVLEFSGVKDMHDEIFRRSPSELLISEKDFQTLSSSLEEFKKGLGVRVTKLENWNFDHETAFRTLSEHFGVHSLDGFGLKGMAAAITAAGSLLHYVQENLSLKTSHIKRISPDHLSSYLSIDQATQRNLELTEPLHKGSANFTLLKLLDQTITPMGARLLKSWLIHPLLSPREIRRRQEGIEELMNHLSIRDHLRPVRDLERLMMRVSTGSATPRDLVALKVSLKATPEVAKSLEPMQAPIIRDLLFPPIHPITEKIHATLVDEPPVKLGDGKVIREGISKDLDELRSLKSNSQSWIAKYQTELREITGIKTLKIIFSKAFGYCIEVSRGQAERMPDTFQRRQTLVNNERFISPELKAYEEKILTAEEKIQAIEGTLYQELRKEIATHSDTINAIAKSIATLDTLLSLTIVAAKKRYIKPQIDESNVIDIEVGRHPVIESSLLDDSFIPNDTKLDKNQNLVIITGPNMAGKSTYIRQVALIVILAQMGSFIPAQKGRIGIVDKVFSRIGASDDLSRGQSTFMIEMTETANILNNATSRSLVILDEIGRGTSTFDGISIAWAVAEHLIKMECKTLFATHYWELTELDETHSSVKNVHVAVQEAADRIVFLRKIVSGSTDKSYGIHVARLAGLPATVLTRAHEVLHKLEENDLNAPEKPSPKAQEQLSFFSPTPSPRERELEALAEELKKLKIDETTPLAALKKLSQWKSDFSL
ncbi:MAG: DNA mismatch repair protein MutS [Simkaniaceae bacterium]|nr:MAG: DNA mismatch repair protein MutS [Simkaniaceae bacterium]